MLVRRSWPSRPAFENALADFEQLRREMQRMFDGQTAADATGIAGPGLFPPVNVTHDADQFYVRADVPGIDAKDLSISAVKNRLSIAGKREIATEHDRVSYHRKERPEGSFNRTLTLPTELDVERIEARYADGVLTLRLPKAEAAKPRQITVKR
jgi:HSP20 family protein